jgi:hypothetical protein
VGKSRTWLFVPTFVKGAFTWQSIYTYTTGLEGRRGNSDSIATGYGLDLPGNESRCWRDFPYRLDRLRGPPSLLYNGYRVFPEGKAAGSWCWPPTPSILPPPLCVCIGMSCGDIHEPELFCGRNTTQSLSQLVTNINFGVCGCKPSPYSLNWQCLECAVRFLK